MADARMVAFSDAADAPWAAALPVLGPSVVVDPDMPDDEWRIAVWRF